MKKGLIKNVKNTMRGELSLDNIINGTYYNAKREYCNIAQPLREKCFYEFKEFLLNKCHYGSKMYNQINGSYISNVGNYGIYRRLMIKIDKQNNLKVHYNAGQSYPDEIRTLKDCFSK